MVQAGPRGKEKMVLWPPRTHHQHNGQSHTTKLANFKVFGLDVSLKFPTLWRPVGVGEFRVARLHIRCELLEHARKRAVLKARRNALLQGHCPLTPQKGLSRPF